MLNADLATGAEAVTMLSCFPLEPADEQDLAALRDGGATVTLISPDERLLWKNFLDQQLVPLAYQVGRDQATTQVEHLATAWSP